MPFGPVDSQADFVALEHNMLERWRRADLLEQVKASRKGANPWVFYEGPPTANARPGLHHVWPRAFKDLWMRFQTMRGHDVPRKGGWDCHGLPVEIEVEKELGISFKHEIEALGVEEFNRRCRESVGRYVNDFVALTERSAVWIDTRDTYWTLNNDYIESVWWLVRQLYEQGLLYEGHRVVPYCPRCGTALSSHELGQPGAYRDITEPSIFVRFPVVDRDVDLLVWTTTPWTLISNTGAAVGPDIEYVRVRSTDSAGLRGPNAAAGLRGPNAVERGRDLVMAAALAPEDAEVVDRWLGRDLVGWRYQRPFQFLPIDERGQRVVPGDFVSTEEGSGIVHLAPAFGADDMEAGKAHDLPVLNPVGADGAFTEQVPPWQGRQVKAADREIIDDLAARGVLVREEAYTHAYPHCWRCGTALIYWAKNSWFVRTSEHKGDLLRENERINWDPEHIKHGRFGDWLQNNVDWALSRDRYWGTPLPIWRCMHGHDTCIGSVAELSELARRDLSELDLHRPYVDAVELSCPVCDMPARRLPPVLDAWFDSGSMPSAQHHYPFGDKAAFERNFPADFICEAIDQTRGWFYSLLAVNTLVFDSTPYLNVVVLALVVDEFGQKMSKSKGNVLDPWQILETFGADALRWYFFSAGSPWTSRRVYEDGIREATRKTLLTVWNVFAFFATYADIDGWEPEPDDALPQPTHVLDRWVLAVLDTAVVEVTERMDAFDALGASAAVAGLVDDLSNWYVRRSRPRFWGAGGAGDPVALATLHHCLVVTAQLLAPFCPFLADELYTRLTGVRGPNAMIGNTSVHLSDWPEPSAWADAGLVAEMAAARRLVGLGRAARTDAGVRLRQPLRRALLLYPDAELSDDVRQEVASELNVQGLEDVASLEELMSWTVVPNFRALGPRLGRKVNEVKQALAEADGAALRRQLEAQGWIEVAGERLERGDVEVRAGGHEEFALAQEGGWAVALDLELDDDLRHAGMARELVRELNDLRKRLDLALTDRVAVRVGAGPRLAAALDAHDDWVAQEVLAASLEVVPPGSPAGGAYEIAIDEEPARVELRAVTSSPGS
jgi:isoleucyl-tRNA synthetase